MRNNDMGNNRMIIALATALAWIPLACGGPGTAEREGQEEGEEYGAPEVGAERAPGEAAPGEARGGTTPGEARGELVSFTVPAGTTVRVTLDQELGTERNETGDRFTVSTGESLMVGDGVAVPARSTIRGTVTAVQHSEARGKPAVIKLSFDELQLDDRGYPIQATLVDANPEVRSRTSTAEGAAKVGAAAAAGGIIGRIIGGDAQSTLIGAAVGAAAGTAIVLGTSDADAVLPAGSEMSLRLDRDLRVERRVASR